MEKRTRRVLRGGAVTVWAERIQKGRWNAGVEIEHPLVYVGAESRKLAMANGLRIARSHVEAMVADLGGHVSWPVEETHA